MGLITLACLLGSHLLLQIHPDGVDGAIMGPTWALSAPDGPHVGPMNIVIWAMSLLLKLLTVWSYV